MAGYVVHNSNLVPMSTTTNVHTTDLRELANCSLKVMPNLDGFNPNNKRAQILADPTLRTEYFKNWLNVYAMSVGEPLAGDICLDPAAISQLVDQSVAAFEAYYAMSAVHQERPDKAAMAVLNLINNNTVPPKWNSIMDDNNVKTDINNNRVAKKIVFNHPVAVAAMVRSMSTKNFVNADGSFDKMNTSCTIVFDQGFYLNTSLDRCQDINFSNAITASNVFFGCSNLSEQPRMINMENLTTLEACFRNNVKLPAVSLDSTPKCSNIAQIVMGCASLTRFNMEDASGVTSATDSFASCPNLASITLNGISRVNFSVANTKLDAAGLNALFNSLGTTTGRTIAITGCPGAGTCDRTIATAKGWTVSG